MLSEANNSNIPINFDNPRIKEVLMKLTDAEKQTCRVTLIKRTAEIEALITLIDKCESELDEWVLGSFSKHCLGRARDCLSLATRDWEFLLAELDNDR